MSSNVQPGAKGEHLREEMEEAANRMEICRVSLHLLFSRSRPLSHLPQDVFSEICLFSEVKLLYFFQDQLSADMYNFVAKEIDYASYFQAVSTLISNHTHYCMSSLRYSLNIH